MESEMKSDKHGLPLADIEDVPSFFCWTCMGRFDVTAHEFHGAVGHDTTLKELPGGKIDKQAEDIAKTAMELDTTLRELSDYGPSGQEEKKDG